MERRRPGFGCLYSGEEMTVIGWLGKARIANVADFAIPLNYFHAGGSRKLVEN